MSHYFDEIPDVGHAVRTIESRFNGINFIFETDRGVFSRDRIDFGTELLIQTFLKHVDKPQGTALDLGCGYGPVGIVLKRCFPWLNVILSDINARALELAERNVRANLIGDVTLVSADGVPVEAFGATYVLTNPPIRAGKKTVHRLFAESYSALAPQGQLYVVIQKKQGAASAEKVISELFGNCLIVTRSAGYRVLLAEKLL